ncbi:MAG: hypothetical protein R3B70_06920 [Polyangiaceae bacterium]
MRRSLSVLLGGVLASSVLLSGATAGAETLECPLHRPVPVTRLYFKLSVDLRGRVPTIEEYAALEDLDDSEDLPDFLIDDMLGSGELVARMREYHRSIFFPVIGGTNGSIRDNDMTLRDQTIAAGVTAWASTSTARRKKYRGGDGSHLCKDVPQTDLQPTYKPGDAPTCPPSGTDAAGAFCQEGYTTIKPYWDPSAAIKICAFEAQKAEMYTVAGKGDFPCNMDIAQTQIACGCGPSLQYCMKSTSDLDNEVRASWQEQFLLMVDEVIAGPERYDWLFTTQDVFTNGVLDHYYKYLAQASGTSRVYNAPSTSDYPLPDKPDWADKSFRREKRAGIHSGILTLPAFTLRYQTNRGRANKVYQALMGKYFIPPDPKDTMCETEGTDLTKRCVCRKCHETLEPLAAYFGAVSEAGSALVNDLPPELPDVAACKAIFPPASSTAWCNRLYIQTAISEDKSVYRQRALEFMDTHPEVKDHYDQGPGGLFALAAEKTAEGEPGLFWQATVRHMFEYLMKREMDLDPSSPENEREILMDLAGDLADTGDFKALVRAIVTLPAYRRMP